MDKNETKIASEKINSDKGERQEGLPKHSDSKVDMAVQKQKKTEEDKTPSKDTKEKKDVTGTKSETIVGNPTNRQDSKGTQGKDFEKRVSTTLTLKECTSMMCDPEHKTESTGRVMLNSLKAGIDKFDPIAWETARLIANQLYVKTPQTPSQLGAYAYHGSDTRTAALGKHLGLTPGESKELAHLVRGFVPKDNILGMDYAGRKGTDANLADQEANEKLSIVLNPGSGIGGIMAGFVGMAGGTAEDMRNVARAGGLLEAAGLARKGSASDAGNLKIPDSKLKQWGAPIDNTPSPKQVTSRVVQGGAIVERAVATTLVGSDTTSFRVAAAKYIKDTPNHPLKFLLDENGKFKPTKGLKHSELADRPDLVQMGHITSNKAGEAERVVLQGAWENQFSNVTVETSKKGSYMQHVAIDIGGVGVELETAKLWEKAGQIPQGTVAAARRVQ